MRAPILRRWMRRYWPRSSDGATTGLGHLLAPVTGDVYFEELLQAWDWLVPHDARLLVVTAFGDVFLTTASGSVLFLDTAGGTCVEVAASVGEWQEKIQDGALRDEWFLPGLLKQLRKAGRHLSEGECYSPLQSPGLGGTFSVENWQPTFWRVHIAYSGSLHAAIKDLPPGTKITAFKFTPL